MSSKANAQGGANNQGNLLSSIMNKLANEPSAVEGEQKGVSEAEVNHKVEWVLGEDAETKSEFDHQPGQSSGPGAIF
jgi:hypothetical protein